MSALNNNTELKATTHEVNVAQYLSGRSNSKTATINSSTKKPQNWRMFFLFSLSCFFSIDLILHIPSNGQKGYSWLNLPTTGSLAEVVFAEVLLPRSFFLFFSSKAVSSVLFVTIIFLSRSTTINTTTVFRS